MDCNKIQERISLYIDKQLSGVELYEFEEHIRNCEVCKMEASQMLEIIEDIRSLPQLELPDNFHNEMMKHIKTKGVDEKDMEYKKPYFFKVFSNNNWRTMSGIAIASCFVFIVLAANITMIRNNKSKNIAENWIQQRDLEAMVAEAKISDSSEGAVPNSGVQAATTGKESETTAATKDNIITNKENEATVETTKNKTATTTKERETKVATRDNKMATASKASEATVETKENKLAIASKESEATVVAKENKMVTTTKENAETVETKENKMAIATKESEVIPAVKEYRLGIATKESETIVAINEGSDGMVGNGNDTLNFDSSKKIIKTVDLSLQSYDSNRSIQNLKNITEQYGGYIENANNNVSDTNQKKDINLEARIITLKIPNERYDSLITSVATLGSVKQNNEYIEDITNHYMDTESLIADKKLEKQTLFKRMEKATAADLIPLQKQLSAVESELDTYTDQISNWDRVTKFSTVIVKLQ